MKRFLIFLFSIMCAAVLVVPAFAAEAGEGESTDSGESTVLVPDVNVYNDITLSDDDIGTYLTSSVYTYSVADDGASDLKSVLIDFIGEWDVTVVEHAYQADDGSINYLRETQLDWPWLCSAGLLVLMIFCLFRLGGSILCKT